MEKLYLLNESIRNKKIAIFGTGYWGKIVFYELLKEGLKVECFVDRREQLNGDFLLGKRVISEEELIESDFSVIIASTYWKEILIRLENKGIKKDFYIMNMFNGELEI